MKKRCENHPKQKAITLMVHDSEDVRKYYYCENCTRIILDNESPLRLVWLEDIKGG